MEAAAAAAFASYGARHARVSRRMGRPATIAEVEEDEEEGDEGTPLRGQVDGNEAGEWVEGLRVAHEREELEKLVQVRSGCR